MTEGEGEEEWHGAKSSTSVLALLRERGLDNLHEVPDVKLGTRL